MRGVACTLVKNNQEFSLHGKVSVNTQRLLLLALIFLAIAGTSPLYAQTETGPLNLLVLLPGMTQVIDIRQAQTFPLGCPHFFIAVVGSGTLGVSVKKEDVAGDLIFMTGLAASDAGTFPIFRIGMSKGMIDQIVEIGSPDKPYGFVWVYCGVGFSQSTPRYNAQLRVSLAP